MSKLQIKGILKKVFPAETVGKNSVKKVTITVFRPGYTDEYGDKVGTDDYFEFSTFNDKVPETLLTSLLDKKVEVVGYLNSYEYDEVRNNAPTGQKRHALSLSLAKITESKPVQ